LMSETASIKVCVYQTLLVPAVTGNVRDRIILENAAQR